MKKQLLIKILEPEKCSQSLAKRLLVDDGSFANRRLRQYLSRLNHASRCHIKNETPTPVFCASQLTIAIIVTKTEFEK